MESNQAHQMPFWQRFYDSLSGLFMQTAETEPVSNTESEVQDSINEVVESNVEPDDLPSPDLPVYGAELKQMQDEIKRLDAVIAKLQDLPATVPIQLESTSTPQNQNPSSRANQVLQALQLIGQNQ